MFLVLYYFLFLFLLHFHQQLITFLNTCLQRDPKLRPDITSLLMHPFVSHMVLPPGMSASSNWAGTSGQAQYGNRPSTVSHAVVGEWDSRESSSSLSNSNNTFHRDTSGGGGGREAAGSGRDMRERTLPVSTFYSTGGGGQGQAQLGQGQQREVAADNHTTAVRTTGASRHTADSHVPQIFTLELPTAMPTSARGQQHQTHVNTNSNTNTAEDPELMLEVDHSRVQSRTHSRVPSMDVDFAQLSSQTTPRFAQQHNQSHQHQQVDAGVPGRGALPNRLVALANTNTSNNVTASPSSARSLKGAGNLKAKQQSPVNTSATAAAAVSPSNGGGGGGGGSSGGGSGSKSALHKRNKRREQAARESTTDSPFNTPFGANPSTTAALGAMEAQLAQLISHPTTATAAVAAAGMKSGEKADPSEGQEAHFEHSVPSVNEDEIDTPPNTISIPKLNIHHLGDGSSFTNIHSNAVADQSRMADLFHKELLAAAEADPYLRTNLEYPSSNYPSSRSNRSTTGAASSVQGGNKNPQQQQQQQKQRKQKASKKQPRTRLRSDFSSFDSEDTTSGWHHNASATTGGAGDGASVNAGAGGSVGREYEMDADSVTGGADDDTLYSADMLAGYSSAEAEGVLEESTPVPTTTAGSGIAQHGHQRSADRNSSSLSVPVLSHANSNVTTASANSPVNPVVLRGVKSAFNAIQQGNNSSMQYSDFKKVGGQSTSSGFSAESSSKGVLRPNFSKPQVITGPVSWKRLNNSRSQTELAVEDVSTPTAGATTATAAGGGSKGGTSVIKPTSLQTAPSGWRRQDKRERDQASLASTAAASASAAVDAATAAVSATTVTPTTATTTTAGSDMQDGQYLYEGGLSKARSYSGLGIGGHGDNSSLDGYNSTAEEIPDESHMMLHEDSTIAPSAYNPAGLRHSQQLQGQGQTQAQQTQQRRSQVQKAHNRQQRERERERERERDRDIQLDSDIADMTTLMNITGTSFDQQARTSTAATSASGLQLQHLNASLTGSLVLGTPSAASSARTGGSLKSSLSRRTLEVVSTPTVGASRNGSRQPLRTANRMHREKEKDTDKDTADPLDISCDSLDKLQIMGTAAATNSTRAGDREGTAKISTGTRQQSRRGGTNTAGGSRRNEEQPTQSAHLAQAYSGAGGGGGGGGGGNANLSMTSVDDEPEVVNSLFSAPPTSLDEHTAAITRLRAPERTNLLLSSSLDGTIRIWGPDSGGISDGGTGSRAVLEATGFKSSDNAYGAFADQRPERRITLGGDNNSSNGGGDSSSVTGTATGTGTARSATVKISNMWVDEACETIWAACSDAAMRVWSGGEGRPLRLLKGHEDQITAMEGMDTASSSASHLLQSSVSGNPTTCMMATGSADRTVRVWDVRAKKAQVFSFRGHGDTVLALRWGEGGRSLVSAAKDKTVRIWDTRAGR